MERKRVNFYRAMGPNYDKINNMKKIWVHKANSFREAEKFDREYYFHLGVSKRIEIMQLLREMYLKINKRAGNENRKRLRRVITFVQQK